jgi:hypothetical protein
MLALAAGSTGHSFLVISCVSCKLLLLLPLTTYLTLAFLPQYLRLHETLPASHNGKAKFIAIQNQ